MSWRAAGVASSHRRSFTFLTCLPTLGVDVVNWDELNVLSWYCNFNTTKRGVYIYIIIMMANTHNEFQKQIQMFAGDSFVNICIVNVSVPAS